MRFLGGRRLANGFGFSRGGSCRKCPKFVDISHPSFLNIAIGEEFETCRELRYPLARQQDRSDLESVGAEASPEQSYSQSCFQLASPLRNPEQSVLVASGVTLGLVTFFGFEAIFLGRFL